MNLIAKLHLNMELLRSITIIQTKYLQMRKFQVYLVLTVFLSFCTLTLTGQFSVVYKYQPNQIEWQDEWNNHVSEDVIFETSHFVGISYWLRLKNYRVEFHPTAYITTSKQSINVYDELLNSGSEFPDIKSAVQNGFGAEVPVHFYFLDIEGDCNCPTFSKQGNILTKGLYAYLSPGVRRLSYVMYADDGETVLPSVDSQSNQTFFTAAAGLGLDIGLGDLFTITPFAGLEFAPNLKWDSYNETVESAAGFEVKESRDLRSVVLGARLSFRPDYLRDKKAMYR